MEPVPFKEVSFRGHARATPRLVSFQGFHMGVPPPPEICEFILNSRQCKNPLGKFYRRKGILCKQTSVIQKGFFGAFVLLQPRNVALLLRWKQFLVKRKKTKFPWRNPLHSRHWSKENTDILYLLSSWQALVFLETVRYPFLGHNLSFAYNNNRKSERNSCSAKSFSGKTEII